MTKFTIPCELKIEIWIACSVCKFVLVKIGRHFKSFYDSATKCITIFMIKELNARSIEVSQTFSPVYPSDCWSDKNPPKPGNKEIRKYLLENSQHHDSHRLRVSFYFMYDTLFSHSLVPRDTGHSCSQIPSVSYGLKCETRFSEYFQNKGHSDIQTSRTTNKGIDEQFQYRKWIAFFMFTFLYVFAVFASREVVKFGAFCSISLTSLIEIHTLSQDRKNGCEWDSLKGTKGYRLS